MRIDSAQPFEIRSVALAMRESDYAEFSAVSFDFSRQALAETLVQRLGRRPDTIVGALEEPICIGVPLELRPNVITLMFFATDRFPEIGLPITRFIVRQLFPKLRAAGVHRFETIAMAGDEHRANWLKTLGLKPETGALLNYGRNGEVFVQYSWTAPCT